MPGKAKWTDEQIELLLELRKKGLSAREITKQINDTFGMEFSRNAVLGKAFRMCSEKYKTKKVYKNRPLPETEFKGTIHINDITRKQCSYMDSEKMACGKSVFNRGFCEEHYFECYPPNKQKKFIPKPIGDGVKWKDR